MKRHIGMLAMLTCLALTQSPKGMAHGVVHGSPYFVSQRIVVVHDSYAAERYRGTRPRWLQTHRHFYHWYLHSRYRHAHRLSWLQLYDLYGLEVRYHRPVRHVKFRSSKHNRYLYERKHGGKKQGRKNLDRYKRKRGG